MTLKLRNFWLNKIKEKSLLKIVEWAQRLDKNVETLTKEEIEEASKSQAR